MQGCDLAQVSELKGESSGTHLRIWEESSDWTLEAAGICVSHSWKRENTRLELLVSTHDFLYI